MSRALSVHKRRLLALPVTALVQTAGSFLHPPDEPPARTRVFTPWVTFWVFLAQVLSRARTCSEAVRQAQGWFRAQQERELSSNTSAYCQARLRLPQSHVDSALAGVVRHLNAQEKARFCGRRVCVVDGSSCSMPDTPANQAGGGIPRLRGALSATPAAKARMRFSGHALCRPVFAGDGRAGRGGARAAGRA